MDRDSQSKGRSVVCPLTYLIPGNQNEHLPQLVMGAVGQNVHDHGDDYKQYSHNDGQAVSNQDNDRISQQDQTSR